MYINVTEGIDKRESLDLARETGTDEICASLLLARGISDPQEAKKFLYATADDLTDPYCYSGMEEAVKKIKSVIGKGGKFLFYGDYDCDGIGAVSILTRAFTGKGIKNTYYIPIRADEGYGLNIEAIEKIKERINPDLILTVDCGISSKREAKRALDLGMEIIVTDHHRIGDELPECTVIDPCLNSELTPLCGAGVAFALLRALFGDIYAFNFMDICAISTVADIVPLLGDNRIIVKYGLEMINKGKTKTGIRKLIEKSDLNYRYVNSTDIAFKIAPRLNAAGRLETAKTSAKLLITDDITEASLLAEELCLQNAERQEIGEKIFSSAMKRLCDYGFRDNKIIVLCDPDWNEGVNGIAAARLVEYFNFPTILLTKKGDGTLKGSARSIAGINIFDAIGSQKDLLLSFGGHAMAAGLSLRVENFEKFKKGINEYIKSHHNEEIFSRKVGYDMDLSIKLINSFTIKKLFLLEPFGYKNPAPQFMDNTSYFKFNLLKKKHLKASNSGVDIVAFNKGTVLPAYDSAKERHILYNVEKNYFNGEITNRVRIRDINISSFVVPNEVLNCRAIAFSNSADEERISPKKSVDGVTLHVFFNGENFENFRKKNPEMRYVYAEVDDFDYVDTAVLSPGADFPFCYYDKTIIHEELPEKAERFFAKIGAEFKREGKMFAVDFNIEAMRETYKAIRNIAKRQMAFDGEDDIYKQQEIALLSLPIDAFFLYFYIMMDVKLLKWSNGAILETTAGKVNLEESAIYRYVNE